MSPRPKKTKEISYEKAFSELQEIVEKLESGGVSLEESLAIYTRGRELAALCSKLLDSAELRIRELSVNLEEDDMEEVA